MTSTKQARLQGKLRKTSGLVTLLVEPAIITEPDWANKDFPVEAPYVLADHLTPEGFFVPGKAMGSGVRSVTTRSHKEIPVQWIADFIAGPAYTLAGPDGTPVAIAPDYESANKKFAKLWPPRDVHSMPMGSRPAMFDPSGRFVSPSWKRAGGSGLEYPWHA